MSTNDEIIAELTVAYWMEIETMQNYVSNSINLITVRAEEIKKSLAGDVAGEFGHAQELAQRIHVLGGTVPGSMDFKARQTALQPGPDPSDVGAVIRGVITAEEEAIAQYNKIIKLCDGIDYVTQDLCVKLLSDEESHRREFIGFLAEYDQKPA